MNSTIQDRNHYDTLFKEYHIPIICFINSYIGDRYKAEDIAQNVFLLLWERWNEIDWSCSVKSYIYTIAKNLTLDHLKHQKIQQSFFEKNVSLTKEVEEDLNIEALACFNTEVFQQKLKILKIKKLVMTLPFSDRKIFILSKFNNLTYSEIAELLNISTKTVEKRMTISLKFLRKNFHIIIFTVGCNHL